MALIVANTGGLTLNTLFKGTPDSIMEKKDTVKVVRHALRAATPDEGRTVIIVLATVTQESGHNYEQEVRYLGRKKYWVSCSCNNFRYVWEYALTQKGASDIIHSNGQPPVEMNPRLVTGVCKHLYHILSRDEVINRLQEEWTKSSRLARIAR